MTEAKLSKMMISVHHLFHENFVLCMSFSQKGMTSFHENFVLCMSFSQKGMTFDHTMTNCGEMTQQGTMNFLRDDDVNAMVLSVGNALT
jgi:alanine-alpha-ketoisovalerate/valine-pyruvate aminotransferase